MTKNDTCPSHFLFIALRGSTKKNVELRYVRVYLVVTFERRPLLENFKSSLKTPGLPVMNYGITAPITLITTGVPDADDACHKCCTMFTRWH